MSKPVTLDPSVKQQMRQYAVEANENHRAAMDAEASALKYARAAGDALRQAKQCIGHGGWGAWLKENFKASDRTANSYMRLAEEWDKLEPLFESDHTPLSIRGALLLLKPAKCRGDRIDDDYVAEHGFPNVAAEIEFIRRKLQKMIDRHFVPKVSPEGEFARFVWYDARDDWAELLDKAITQFTVALEERLGERWKAWEALASATEENEDDEDDDVATIPVPRKRERLSA